MSEQIVKRLAAVARGVFLILLAGLLIGRREFAHLNIGDFWFEKYSHVKPPAILANAFVTETTLLALFPLAVLIALDRFNRADRTTVRDKFSRAFGWGICAPAAFIAWGAAHALLAKFAGGGAYLIFRQSALAFYPIAFLYAFLFFGENERHARWAAWSGVAAALLCALLDCFHFLDPFLDANGQPPYGEWMPIYGQETLPIAILGLAFLAVSAQSWRTIALCLFGVCLAGWRQGVRPMQSVVPIGIAGALAMMMLIGGVLFFFKQRAPLRRVALCLVVFLLMAAGYRGLRAISSKPEPPGTETSSEINAWSVHQYAALFELFDRTQPPADPAQRMISRRPPYIPVDDPEVYRLEAVFHATPTVSVRNNIWRLLVWRRMIGDWRDGRPIVGAGVGKPWFYRALYSSGFHYGDEREGLDPHNSYLNILYRYGVIGLGLVLVAIAVVLCGAFKALRARGGDILLEALLLYFGYTLVFACFTVSLEGPPYSLPFWIALGLVYARALQVLTPAPNGVK